MEITRTPRPKGTTEIGHTYNKTQSKEDLNFLQDHILGHYINTGFTYCKEHLTIEEFAEYLQMDKELVLQYVVERGEDRMDLLDPEESGRHLRALISTALNETLADRSRALKQYSILASSQGNEYKAFISGEVNKALKLTQESTKGLVDLMKALGGSQALSVIINNQQNNEVEVNNYLTAEQALLIMERKDNRASLLEDPKAKEQLYQSHSIGGMPVVKANEQRGLDTSNEGLSFNALANLSDKLLTDEDEQTAKDNHEDRRAREMGEDLDQDHV